MGGNAREGNRRRAERQSGRDDHEAHGFIQDHRLQCRNRNAPINNGNRNSAPPKRIRPPSAPMIAPPPKANPASQPVKYNMVEV